MKRRLKYFFHGLLSVTSFFTMNAMNPSGGYNIKSYFKVAESQEFKDFYAALTNLDVTQEMNDNLKQLFYAKEGDPEAIYIPHLQERIRTNLPTLQQTLTIGETLSKSDPLALKKIDDNGFTSFHRDGTQIIWIKQLNGAYVCERKSKKSVDCRPKLRIHLEDDVYASADGANIKIKSIGSDSFKTLYPHEHRVHPLEKLGHEYRVHSLAKLGDGCFASGSYKNIKIWKSCDDECGYRCDQIIDLGGSGNVVSLVSLDEERFAAASHPGQTGIGGITIWAKRSSDLPYECEDNLFEEDDTFASLLITLNKDYLISSAYNGPICLWRRDSDNRYHYERALRHHTGPVWQLLALDNSHFASASADGTIKIWNLHLDLSLFELALVGALMRCQKENKRVTLGLEYAGIFRNLPLDLRMRYRETVQKQV